MISIENLSLLAGGMPPRPFGLIVEWASIHKNDLERVWGQAVNCQKLDKIEPLD